MLFFIPSPLAYILHGLVISVEMPQNHEQRYFIEGPDEYIGSNNNQAGGVTTSTLLVIAPADEIALNAFSIHATGICIVEAILRDGTSLHTRTLVR